MIVMQQKAVVLLNTRIKNQKKLNELLQNADIIICANGGIKNLFNLNYEPDIILGDFDSVDREILEKFKKKSKLIKYPEVKDKTAI